jgi:hypothetical protein
MMGSRTPRKHLPYYAVLEQLESPGCGVCELAKRSAEAYLDSFSSEFVTDPTARQRLRESFGFCGNHARQFEEVAGVLPTAIVYEDLLRLHEDELESWVRAAKRPGAPPPCPACQSARHQEMSSLRVMTDFIDDPELAEAFHQSDGLCRGHLNDLCRILPELSRRRVLAEEKERIRRLLADLAEVKRKSDYRAAGEAWTEAEKTAATRAVAKLAGPRGRLQE